jgi:hypothetical protein
VWYFRTHPATVRLMHDPDEEQAGTMDRSRTIKTTIPITTDANGEPEIPSVTSSDGYYTKAVQDVLRAYCITHLRELYTFNMAVCGNMWLYDSGFTSGKKMAKIPWKNISRNPSAWIDKDCAPSGFHWEDPSRMHGSDIFRLLDHLRQRQENGLAPLIWNPFCELFADTDLPSEVVRTRQRAGSGHSHSHQREESDGTSGNDEEEDVAPESERISDDGASDDGEEEDFTAELEKVLREPSESSPSPSLRKYFFSFFCLLS